MKYELINPSDAIFYDAPDAVHSAMATALLSSAYGGNCLENSEHSSPIFLLGGASEWIEEKSGLTPDEFIEKNAQTLHDTLKSFRYEGERTSLNRIVDRAHEYASAIQKKFLQKKESAGA